MNNSIEQLKSEALSELKQETTETVEVANETKLTGEVIAEIISFDNLQAKLSASNKETIQAEASKLLSEGKFDEVQTLLNSAKSKALQLANILPRYILLTKNGTNYLVEAPKVAIKSNNSNGEKRTNGQKYPAPFNYGDKIYLINKEGTTKSQVYEITQVALVGCDDHEPIKASIAVRNFMVNQLNKVENPTGYAGTSFGMWKKVVQ